MQRSNGCVVHVRSYSKKYSQQHQRMVRIFLSSLSSSFLCFSRLSCLSDVLFVCTWNTSTLVFFIYPFVSLFCTIRTSESLYPSLFRVRCFSTNRYRQVRKINKNCKALLIGTKFDLFDKFEHEEKEEITKQVALYPKSSARIHVQ